MSLSESSHNDALISQSDEQAIFREAKKDGKDFDKNVLKFASTKDVVREKQDGQGFDKTDAMQVIEEVYGRGKAKINALGNQYIAAGVMKPKLLAQYQKNLTDFKTEIVQEVSKAQVNYEQVLDNFIAHVNQLWKKENEKNTPKMQQSFEKNDVQKQTTLSTFFDYEITVREMNGQDLRFVKHLKDLSLLPDAQNTSIEGVLAKAQKKYPDLFATWKQEHQTLWFQVMNHLDSFAANHKKDLPNLHGILKSGYSTEKTFTGGVLDTTKLFHNFSTSGMGQYLPLGVAQYAIHTKQNAEAGRKILEKTFQGNFESLLKTVTVKQKEQIEKNVFDAQQDDIYQMIESQRGEIKNETVRVLKSQGKTLSERALNSAVERQISTLMDTQLKIQTAKEVLKFATEHGHLEKTVPSQYAASRLAQKMYMESFQVEKIQTHSKDFIIQMVPMMLSGGVAGLAANMTKGLMTNVMAKYAGSELFKKLVISSAGIVVEGVTFHTASSLLNSPIYGAQAWDHYFEGCVSSVTMFTAIKSGNIIWDKLFHTRFLEMIKSGKITSERVKDMGMAFSYLGQLGVEGASFMTVGELEKYAQGKKIGKDLASTYVENIIQILEMRAGGKLITGGLVGGKEVGKKIKATVGEIKNGVKKPPVVEKPKIQNGSEIVPEKKKSPTGMVKNPSVKVPLNSASGVQKGADMSKKVKTEVVIVGSEKVKEEEIVQKVDVEIKKEGEVVVKTTEELEQEKVMKDKEESDMKKKKSEEKVKNGVEFIIPYKEYVLKNSVVTKETKALFPHPEKSPSVTALKNEQTEIFGFEKSFVEENYKLTAEERIEKAKDLVKSFITTLTKTPRIFTPEMEKAIIDAHEQPLTQEGVMNKLIILQKAGFTRAEAKLFIESGVCGEEMLEKISLLSPQQFTPISAMGKGIDFKVSDEQKVLLEKLTPEEFQKFVDAVKQVPILLRYAETTENLRSVIEKPQKFWKEFLSVAPEAGSHDLAKNMPRNDVMQELSVITHPNIVESVHLSFLLKKMHIQFHFTDGLENKNIKELNSFLENQLEKPIQIHVLEKIFLNHGKEMLSIVFPEQIKTQDEFVKRCENFVLIEKNLGTLIRIEMYQILFDTENPGLYSEILSAFNQNVYSKEFLDGIEKHVHSNYTIEIQQRIPYIKNLVSHMGLHKMNECLFLLSIKNPKSVVDNIKYYRMFLYHFSDFKRFIDITEGNENMMNAYAKLLDLFPLNVSTRDVLKIKNPELSLDIMKILPKRFESLNIIRDIDVQLQEKEISVVQSKFSLLAKLFSLYESAGNIVGTDNFYTFFSPKISQRMINLVQSHNVFVKDLGILEKFLNVTREDEALEKKYLQLMKQFSQDDLHLQGESVSIYKILLESENLKQDTELLLQIQKNYIPANIVDDIFKITSENSKLRVKYLQNVIDICNKIDRKNSEIYFNKLVKSNMPEKMMKIFLMLPKSFFIHNFVGFEKIEAIFLENETIGTKYIDCILKIDMKYQNMQIDKKFLYNQLLSKKNPEFLLKSLDDLPISFVLDDDLIGLYISKFEQLPLKNLYTKLIQQVDALNNSDAQELKPQIYHLLMEAKDPQKFFDEVKVILMKNHLPLVGKQYYIFKLLFTDEQIKTLLHSKENLSPMLLHTTDVEKSSNKTNAIIFQDLLKNHILSNNPSLYEYLVLFDSAALALTKMEKAIRTSSTKLLLTTEEQNSLEKVLTKMEILGEYRYGKGEANQKDLKERYKELKRQFHCNVQDTILGKIEKIYFKPLGFTSIKEVLNVMKTSKEEANPKAYVYYNKHVIADKFTLDRDSIFLTKNVHLPIFDQILDTGIVANEFTGARGKSDQTPLDTDFLYYSNATGVIESSVPNEYGNITLVVEDSGQFHPITKVSSTPYIKGKYEMISSSRVADNHVGIRTALPSSEIKAIVAGNLNPMEQVNLFYTLAKKDRYIPVVDNAGKVLFTPEMFDKQKKVFAGLDSGNNEVLSLRKSALADTLLSKNPEIHLDKNMLYQIQAEKGQLFDELQQLLSKAGLHNRNKEEDFNGFELSDTGSTSRNTFLPESIDYDFTLRLDVKDWENRAKILERLSTIFHISMPSPTIDTATYEQYVIKDATFHGKKIDFDLGFEKKQKIDLYSSNMAVTDKLAWVKKYLGEEKYEYVLSNIRLAKKLCKEEGVYKKGEYGEGGLGGIGVEYWILHHNGNIEDAMNSFLDTAYKHGETTPLPFENFKLQYLLLGAGENARNQGSAENFTNNMTEGGYQKMLLLCKKYLKK